MTYLSDRQASRRRITTYLFSVVLLLILAFFWNTIRVGLMPVSAKVSEMLFNVRSVIIDNYDAMHGFFVSKQVLLDTIATLESENDTLRTQIAEGTGTVSTNEVPVDSLFSPLSSLYNSILISKGYASGIEPGMIVYQPGLMPIGTVDEVHDKNSRVKLLSANDSELESFVASSSLVVRLHGDGGGDFVATLPKDAPASIGDTLMWKDHPHMTLGTVIRIDNQPQAVSQTIYVRGAYNPSVHVQLYILTP